MILLDTSVWIDHLQNGSDRVGDLLRGTRVLVHPFVIGEIALGHLRQRGRILAMLSRLPHATAASDAEVLHFIDSQALWGVGIGYVDAHLLAATRLSPGAALWTADRRLAAVADRLGLAARPQGS